MHVYKRAATAAAIAIAISSIGAATADAAPAKRCYPSIRYDVFHTDGTCYQVTSTAKSTFTALYTDALINNLPWASTLACKVEAARSYSSSTTVGVAVTVKAGLIADMNASVAATVVNSVTTVIGSTVNTSVPANRTVYCDRGAYTYRGTVAKTRYPGNFVETPQYFTATAPEILSWRYRL